MRHAKHAPKPHPVEQRPAPVLAPLHVAGQRTTEGPETFDECVARIDAEIAAKNVERRRYYMRDLTGAIPLSAWRAPAELKTIEERSRWTEEYASLCDPLFVPAAILRRCADHGQVPGVRRGKALWFNVQVLMRLANLIETGRAGCGETTIYFVEDGDLIKIGKAKNVAKRMAVLATGNPRGVTLLGTMKGTDDTERMLHDSFREWRVRGEWFKRVPWLLEFVARHASKP